MKYIFQILLVFIASERLAAQIKLPRLISDNMVLQRNTTAKIWGWASPNEPITLIFKQYQLKTISDEKGKWSITLPPQNAGSSGDIKLNGKNELIIKNVVFGDVWICSGQSNMEIDMNRLIDKYTNEINQADYPNIRQFVVPDKYDFHEEKEDFSAGNWQVATPKNVLSFSAVAFFFAKDIYEKYKIPVGIINSALGGSPAEAWISADAIKVFPSHQAEFEKFKNDDLIKQIEDNDRNTSKKWYKQLNETDEGLKQNWKTSNINDADWEEIELPNSWSNTKLGNTNGAIWFRKTIEVTQSMVGKSARLYLGRIVDADSVFINGKFVGSTGYQYPPRRYILPNSVLTLGKNVIAIRVISNTGMGGFIKDKPYKMIIGNDTIALNGKWKYKLGCAMQPLPEQTFVRWKPVGLYNAMIAPLQNLKIKGVVWYQGEANTKKANEYSDLMKTLIGDWRNKWKQGNFPFIYAQLPNYMETNSTPNESNWAELRQQQFNLLSTPNTGMSVNIDLGDWNDIHPFNKKDVGHRLALQAFKIAYGESKNTDSPYVKSAKLNKNQVILTFTNVTNGLKSINNKPLSYFSITDNSGKYVWAKAKISGKNQVVVWSDEIKNPKKVRYAWANNPDSANLYNSINLPASPFEIQVK